jgi:co-chaperonin GroES (HSP10)
VPIPKSEKMARQEAAGQEPAPFVFPTEKVEETLAGPVKIKRVECFNDFVAILQSKSEGNIIQENPYKNEGLVVGTGPGIPLDGGVRCPSQLKMGDVVAFFGKPILELTPGSGVYQGRKVVILGERSIICRLPPIPYEEVQE